MSGPSKKNVAGGGSEKKLRDPSPTTPNEFPTLSNASAFHGETAIPFGLVS